MEWLEVTIKTVSPAIDLLGAKLTAIGYDSFIIDDSADFSEFLKDNTQYWDYVDEELAQKMQDISQIRLYIEQDAHAPERIAHLKSELEAFRAMNPDTDLGSLEVSLQNLKEEDWEESWKQYYQPIPIGEQLLIVPQWLSPENKDHRIPVILDPGMIFGTGAHASTQMCLRALEQVIHGGERVIDLGSGSGILSIGALVLGCREAVGCDIDPKAPDVAMDNAALNGIGADRFRVYAGDILADRGMRAALGTNFDIVLANIVADVILPLAPLSREFLAPGGTFVTSGIIEGRQDEIEHALKKAGYSIEKHFCEEEWHCFVCSVRE